MLHALFELTVLDFDFIFAAISNWVKLRTARENQHWKVDNVTLVFNIKEKNLSMPVSLGKIFCTEFEKIC